MKSRAYHNPMSTKEFDPSTRALTIGVAALTASLAVCAALNAADWNLTKVFGAKSSAEVAEQDTAATPTIIAANVTISP